MQGVIRSAARLVTCLTLLTVVFAGSAWADKFELKDGRELEGTIIRELGDLLSIKLVDGSIVTIERSAITRHKKTETVYDQYVAKRDKVSADDAAAQLSLAKWCASKGLTEEATKHYKFVIVVDPHHIEAREALGFIWIAGDWYLEGSPEAEARQKKAERLTEKPKEIPADYRPKLPKSTPPARPARVSKDTIQIFADERIGKEPPKVSVFFHALRSAFYESKADARLAWVSDQEKIRDGRLIEVKIRVYFLRTHMFYKAIPITNVFKGEAEAQIYEVTDGKKKLVGRLAPFEVPFSASTQLEKEKAFEYAYYETAGHLIYKLSRHAYLKALGVEPQPLPGEGE